MNKKITILYIAALHFSFAVVVPIIWARLSSTSDDNSILLDVLFILIGILWFPLNIGLKYFTVLNMLPWFVSIIFFVGNSCLWGVAIYMGYKWCRRGQNAQPAAQADRR